MVVSCKEDDNIDLIKQENGLVWLSGGLAQCAAQVHLDNGDTLIVNAEKVVSFSSGDKVRVEYKELGVNELCPPGIDGEVIAINRIE